MAGSATPVPPRTTLAIVLVVMLAVLGVAAADGAEARRAEPSGDDPTSGSPTGRSGDGRPFAGYPYLSGPQFLAMFDGSAPPDTSSAGGSAPSITGNAVADARIRKLAEARGYRRRPASTGVLAAIDGQTLHPVAAGALVAMKSAASAEGISIRAVSGYRSPSTQRDAFVSRLGVSSSQIAAGSADGAVDAVLAWVAPPGYSKHQTGHAVDLVQVGGSVDSFGASAAFRWLSSDSYRNARRFGFVPSYPPDGGPQGPNPEPWEYVYVGADRTRQDSPVGGVDVATALDFGRVRVAGWAVDGSHPSAAVEIHAYVGGEAGGAGVVGTSLGTAGGHRADVDAHFRDTGPWHGFDTVASTGSWQGWVPVCVYAVNIGPGGNRLLGCRVVELASGSPFGSLDVVTGTARQLHAQGWAVDPDGPAPAPVHLYVDGVGAAAILADRSRPDVALAHPGVGPARGFDHGVAATPGTRELCAYGINASGSTGGNSLLGCRSAWVVDPDAAFVDLLSTWPFHGAIARLADQGVLGGYEDGSFRPSAPVSRQALVAMLHRLAGSPAAGVASGFVDVGSDHVFAGAVAWAVSVGIVQGYADGTFRPSAPVSRQALVTILHRLAGSPAAGVASGFRDVGSDHVFAGAVAWAVSVGIVQGYADGTFRPGAPVSRQAAAAMLDRWQPAAAP